MSRTASSTCVSMPVSSARAASGSVRASWLRRVQPERDPGERRAEAVVQVAAQPAALLLARGHQRESGLLQCGGRPDGVRGDAAWRARSASSRRSAALKSSPALAVRHDEVSDRLVLVDHREAHRLTARPPSQRLSTVRSAIANSIAAYGTRSAWRPSPPRRQRRIGRRGVFEGRPSRVSASYGRARSP